MVARGNAARGNPRNAARAADDSDRRSERLPDGGRDGASGHMVSRLPPCRKSGFRQSAPMQPETPFPATSNGSLSWQPTVSRTLTRMT